jgi:6-phosphogluconolactonase
MPSPKLLVAPSKAELPPVLCDAIANLAEAAISANGRFSIALSGGSLPKFLGKLPDTFAAKSVDPKWDSWHVFLADERCVPITHDDSNLKSINANFLDLEGVGIPKDQVYGIDAGLTDQLMAGDDGADATTEAIATKYEETLRKVLPEPHTLDLAVLGFGPDGHTCSLFPGHPLLDLAPGKLVASIVDSPKPPPRRITLTLDYLNQHTNHVIVCGAGASKNPIIQAVFDLGDASGDDSDAASCKTLSPKLVSPPPYPCSMVTPKESLTWVVDADAMAGESK